MIKDVQLLECEVHGCGGFARLRRCQVQNLRGDGSRSETYALDMLERPVGADAVAVLAYDPGHAGVEMGEGIGGEIGQTVVLLRRGLRPVPRLGRGGEPPREGEVPPLMHLEVVAGVLEAGDTGEEGLRQRAAEELLEEAGLRVRAEQVTRLGPPVYNSLGIMAERIYLCAAPTELDAGSLEPPPGDGTPLEEGSTPELYTLAQALAMCDSGEIQDAKTELVLRRLAAKLDTSSREFLRV